MKKEACTMKQIIVSGTNPDPTEREIKGRALAYRAATEGIVVLKNDGVLPLREKKIALYGSGARKTIKGGEGSGEVHERYSVSIEQGLLNADILSPLKTGLNVMILFIMICVKNGVMI